MIQIIDSNNHFDIWEKKIFFKIFCFFLRGYIIIFCEKWAKNYIFSYKCQLIGNFLTISTRYDIPYLDKYFHSY